MFAVGAEILSREYSEAAALKNLGPYEIVRSISSGGMGEVYLAEDTRLGRRVAVKLLSPSLMRQEDRLRRFKHEGRAASAISHPNVAHIYEIGEVDEKLFIAMEFVDGQTLRQRLGGVVLTLSEVLDVMTQVASGIVAAHNARIIHRDIKPE